MDKATKATLTVALAFLVTVATLVTVVRWGWVDQAPVAPVDQRQEVWSREVGALIAEYRASPEDAAGRRTALLDRACVLITNLAGEFLTPEFVVFSMDECS